MDGHRQHPPPCGVGALAARLAALSPSCGPVRLVGVDGHAGSGKTTFAARLAEELAGAPVLHLDDLASHAALFDWTGRFTAQITGPLSRGAPAHYEKYDWRRRGFTLEGELRPRPVVLVEGVGAGRRALRPWLAALLWMDLPRASAWARGRGRDGSEQEEFWSGWMRAEQAHFRRDPSRPHAHRLVRERGREPGDLRRPGDLRDLTKLREHRGYDVLPGRRYTWGKARTSRCVIAPLSKTYTGRLEAPAGLDPRHVTGLTFSLCGRSGRAQTRSPRLFPRDRGLRSVLFRPRRRRRPLRLPSTSRRRPPASHAPWGREACAGTMRNGAGSG